MPAKAMTDAERFAALGDEIRVLQTDNGNLRRELRKAQQKTDSAAAIREEIFKIASRSPEPPSWVAAPRGAASKRGTPCTIWSDWHFGEVVRPEEVGGVNKFNTEIGIARAKRLVNTTIDLAFNHMGSAKTQYPGIVIALGGDFMTGNIHEELLATNDRTPQQQVEDLTDTLAAAIERMAMAFGNVYAPAVVGNHGKDAHQRRAWLKRHVHTNHEWSIYCNLERYFRKSKHVHIHVTDETDISFRCQGHRYLLTHGNNLGVKGGDGIIGAIGPIMRGMIKTGRSEAQIGREFDTIIMGHWHQLLWLPGCIVNNSLKGYDEFARLVLRAPYSRPSQALWFTHPEHGITAKWEVFLEGQKSASNANEWVSWEQRKAS